MFNGDHMLRDLTINLGVTEREKKTTQNTYQNKLNLTIDNLILPIISALSTVVIVFLQTKNIFT